MNFCYRKRTILIYNILYKKREFYIPFFIQNVLQNCYGPFVLVSFACMIGTVDNVGVNHVVEYLPVVVAMPFKMLVFRMID